MISFSSSVYINSIDYYESIPGVYRYDPKIEAGNHDLVTEIKVSGVSPFKLLERGAINKCERKGLYLTFFSSESISLENIDNIVLITTKKVISQIKPIDCMNNNIKLIISNNPRLDFIRILTDIERKLTNNTYETVPFQNGTIIRGSVEIAPGCVMKHGSIVGQGGFGFERDEKERPVRFPHLGKVILGENVEIGSNTVVSRGGIENTIIGHNTKIDDLVYIAHNCRIGSNVMIAGNATLCGSVVVGDNAWIGAGALVKQHISIGKNAVVGLGAVVVKDVPPGVTVFGNPAIEYSDSELNDK
ncbi:DapH/DapD/GlmU-related protein [Vibrio sp.]|uniref:DapH/DapD/GlmU-related protein n=1 Tax=Vibrio sp. TaxID=678 RepID=UPI00311FA3AB